MVTRANSCILRCPIEVVRIARGLRHSEPGADPDLLALVASHGHADVLADVHVRAHGHAAAARADRRVRVPDLERRVRADPRDRGIGKLGPARVLQGHVHGHVPLLRSRLRRHVHGQPDLDAQRDRARLHPLGRPRRRRHLPDGHVQPWRRKCELHQMPI